jgi:cobalt-zinc-cadmium resistance protein CzcA
VLDAVAALGGTTVGTVFEGQVRHDIQVRLPESWREDPERIRSIPIIDPRGRPIPLGDLADVASRKARARSSARTCSAARWSGVNVRGRDIAGFVAEAQAAIAARVKLPPGYLVRWGGQFEHLQTASRRLMIVVPLALTLIFLLLYSTFRSLRLAALISLAVPMAATGGAFALAWRGLPFSVSAGVGFIALFGVAVLNGLVWVSAVEHLRAEGHEPRAAALEASLTRLRPILMTALVAGFGFLPMAVATSPGSEIQRPLATVVIGGLVTSTLLTTLVLPAIYPWFAVQEPRGPRGPAPSLPDRSPGETDRGHPASGSRDPIDRITPTLRPGRRAVMRQDWHHLLFLHWAVPGRLAAEAPPPRPRPRPPRRGRRMSGWSPSP